MKKRTIKINQTEAKELIKTIPHTAFWGVVFVKADGSIRKMNCNKSISIGLKNKRKPQIDSTNFILVYDRNADNGKGGYRQVNLHTLKEISTNGKKYIVQ